MDIEDPRFEAYETRFRALAEQIEVQKGPQPEVASTSMYLCLYGENGMPPEEELEMLDKLEQQLPKVKGAEIATTYWEDIVLYVL